VSSLLSTKRFSEKNDTTTLIDYEKELNNQANIREYLIEFLQHLPQTSINSIKLQSLSLVQLTKETNQLTRTTLVNIHIFFYFFFQMFE
jgi:hypothetical protein